MNTEGFIHNMTTHRISLVLVVAALLSVGLPVLALAQDSVEGSWKLVLGRNTPCEISMTADGDITRAADCSVPVARWKATSDGVQLQTASGETYALLKAKAGNLEGATFADMRRVTLSR
jgi:hypothetical protein